MNRPTTYVGANGRPYILPTEEILHYEPVLCSSTSCENIPDEGCEMCEQCERRNRTWEAIDRRYDDKYDR